MIRPQRLAHQAATELRSVIARDFACGSQLPSEKELAERVGVSRNTIREALGELEFDGLVVRRWGSGTFVRDTTDLVSVSMTDIVPIRDVIRGAGHEPEFTYFDVSRLSPPEGMAAIFGLMSGDDVWRIDRIFAVNATPVVFLRDHVPTRINGHDFDPTPLKDADIDLLSLLRDAAHSRITSMDAELYAVAATGELTSWLGVKRHHPLLRTVQVSYAADGRALIDSDIHYRTDAVTLRLRRHVRP
ncbi:MAG: GntR family transcriptional regulator [Actinomycetes bacterium]